MPTNMLATVPWKIKEFRYWISSGLTPIYTRPVHCVTLLGDRGLSSSVCVLTFGRGWKIIYLLRDNCPWPDPRSGQLSSIHCTLCFATAFSRSIAAASLGVSWRSSTNCQLIWNELTAPVVLRYEIYKCFTAKKQPSQSFFFPCPSVRQSFGQSRGDIFFNDDSW